MFEVHLRLLWRIKGVVGDAGWIFGIWMVDSSIYQGYPLELPQISSNTLTDTPKVSKLPHQIIKSNFHVQKTSSI